MFSWGWGMVKFKTLLFNSSGGYDGHFIIALAHPGID